MNAESGTLTNTSNNEAFKLSVYLLSVLTIDYFAKRMEYTLGELDYSPGGHFLTLEYTRPTPL